MTPPQKPPIPREITYRVGRKIGKINVSPEGTPLKARVAALPETNPPRTLPAEARLIRRAWGEAAFPPGSVLLAALLLAPLAVAALAAALLYALIG